jgi:hypothetical protein
LRTGPPASNVERIDRADWHPAKEAGDDFEILL